MLELRTACPGGSAPRRLLRRLVSACRPRQDATLASLDFDLDLGGRRWLATLAASRAGGSETRLRCLVLFEATLLRELCLSVEGARLVSSVTVGAVTSSCMVACCVAGSPREAPWKLSYQVCPLLQLFSKCLWVMSRPLYLTPWTLPWSYLVVPTSVVVG